MDPQVRGYSLVSQTFHQVGPDDPDLDGRTIRLHVSGLPQLSKGLIVFAGEAKHSADVPVDVKRERIKGSRLLDPTHPAGDHDHRRRTGRVPLRLLTGDLVETCASWRSNHCYGFRPW